MMLVLSKKTHPPDLRFLKKHEVFFKIIKLFQKHFCFTQLLNTELKKSPLMFFRIRTGPYLENGLIDKL
jgi:hypothetical protein